MLFLLKILQLQWLKSQWVWRIGGMILTGEIESTSLNTSSSTTVSTTNPKWAWTWSSTVSFRMFCSSNFYNLVYSHTQIPLHAGKFHKVCFPILFCVFINIWIFSHSGEDIVATFMLWYCPVFLSLDMNRYLIPSFTAGRTFLLIFNTPSFFFFCIVLIFTLQVSIHTVSKLLCPIHSQAFLVFYFLLAPSKSKWNANGHVLYSSKITVCY